MEALNTTASRFVQLVLLFIIAVSSLSCSPSSRALRALNNGDPSTFCSLSYENRESEAESANNLGKCYEEGIGGYNQSLKEALSWYNVAASKGVDVAAQNLVRLGATVPQSYYAAKQAEEERQAKLRNIIGGLVGVAAAGAAAYYASKSASASSNTDGYPATANTFVPRTSFQGCCSYHDGIYELQNGMKVCSSTRQILCNDGTWSPECTSNWMTAECVWRQGVYLCECS